MTTRGRDPKVFNAVLGHCPTESSFEQVVQSLRLTPEQYAASVELRAWVRRNKRFKFLPIFSQYLDSNPVRNSGSV